MADSWCTRSNVNRMLYHKIYGDNGGISGYGLRLTPATGVLSLWTLATPEEAQTIEQCQDNAVKDTLTWLEDNATFARSDSGELTKITSGLIAQSFLRYYSAAGDLNLHTHLTISAKVSVIDIDDITQWLELNEATLLNSLEIASTIYDTKIKTHLTEQLELAGDSDPAELGLSFITQTLATHEKYPVHEVVGIPSEQLITALFRNGERRYCRLCHDQGWPAKN